MNRRPQRGPELLPRVTLAALVGGGLAALLVRSLWSVDGFVLAVLVLAAVVFCVLAFARRPAPQQPAYRAAPQPVHHPAEPAAFSWGRPAQATTNGGAPRWRPAAPPAATPPAATPPAADAARPVASAAVSVRDGTRVPVAAAASVRAVQCPRCGDFSVDVAPRAPGFAFRCRRCDADWQWRPGAVWPVSVVRPRAVGRPAARPGLRSS